MHKDNKKTSEKLAQVKKLHYLCIKQKNKRPGCPGNNLKSNTMKTITIQERLHDKCVKANSINELMSITSDFTAEINKTDNIFLSVEKHWCGYGSWKTSAFVNEYHFGEELAEAIKKALSGHITHDEEKEFTPADFQDEITEAVFELANDYFNE